MRRWFRRNVFCWHDWRPSIYQALNTRSPSYFCVRCHRYKHSED